MSESQRVKRIALAVAAAVAIVVALLWLRARSTSGAGDPEAARELPADERARQQELAAIERRRAGLSSALPRYSLRGVVLDSAGAAVPDAAVVLARPRRHARSAADGSFAFEGLPPGRYSVEARREHLTGGPALAALHAGSEPVELRMRRGAVLEVEVSSSGKPVPEADVRVSLSSMYPDAGVQHTRTDERGRARFEGVTLVAHELVVTAPGFVTYVEGIDPMNAEADRWKVQVELEEGVRVSGRVVDQHGRPIAGAVVEAIAGEDGQSPRTTGERERFGDAAGFKHGIARRGVITGDDGVFRIGAGPGKWLVAASHPDYETAGTRISVAGSAPIEDVEIVLGPGITVTGFVVDAEGAPVGGAEIELRWQFGGVLEKTGQADGTGRFELRGLPPAPVEIAAIADGGRSDSEALDLSAGAPEQAIILTLENTAQIRGVVMRAGEPVPSAQVFYVEVANRGAKIHPSVVNTDADGRFVIGGLAAKRLYGLTAMLHQDGDSWFRTVGAEVRAGDEATLTIPDDGSVRGRVVRKDGQSTGELTVEIEGSTQPRPLQGGGFVFDAVPAGKHQLVIRGRGVSETRIGFEIPSGLDFDLGVIELARGRSVAGVVRFFNGEPAGEVDVAVTGANGSSHTTTTDDAGRFALTVPGGQPLTVTARQRRGAFRSLALAANDDASDLTITFTGTGSIEGTVTAGGEPLAGIFVVIPDRADGADRPRAYTETDDAGYFRLELIDEGSHPLAAWIPDPATHNSTEHAKTVTVKAGERTFVDFEIDGAPPAREPEGPR